MYLQKILILCVAFTFVKCKSADIPPSSPTAIIVTSPNTTNDVDFWLTKGDQTVKFEKQPTVLSFAQNANSFQNIIVDDTQTFQTVDGFGYTLTGGSAQVINQLTTAKKQELLNDLFGSSGNSITVNYLRISIGASDLNAAAFTYDDVAAGQTDVSLVNFSLTNDMSNLIPLLKEILLINPNIKIIATPWSAPVWMKDNNSFMGGSLQSQYYSVYSNYFVKYIQKMKVEGINIDAITPQNEPLNANNNPSMLMTAAQQAVFIKNNLGPAFQAANLSTKIIIYDHNCDQPIYPTTILNDAAASPFVDGSAFHLYAGDIAALSTVHNNFPTKNIYFTEQYTASSGSFAGDLKWHSKNVVIGAMRNWSKNALEWNLANDPSFGPHTINGCTTCMGAITIESNSFYTKNVSYYIIAHASKFVTTGAVRIASNLTTNLSNVAFKTTAGKKVLIVENDGNAIETFNIQYNSKWVTCTLEAGAVGTYIW